VINAEGSGAQCGKQKKKKTETKAKTKKPPEALNRSWTLSPFPPLRFRLRMRKARAR
jgi:hypothetical protein